MSTHAIALPGRGILDIQGPDSQKFLHGQCTADVMNLAPGQGAIGGFCTPKGRLYANFYLLCLAADHYWLIMPQAQVTETQARLQKYAAFFKTTLDDASLHWHCVAWRAADLDEKPLTWPAPVTKSASQITLHLGEQTSVQWLNPLAEADYENHMSRLESTAQLLPESAWEQQEIAWGLVWITPETAEEFIPQTIAWDHVGGVSFSKGCYTGQEVVARLHYKGASKKMLRHISGQGNPPDALTSIMDDNAKVMGQVARTAGNEQGWTGLAVMNTNSDATRSATVNQSNVDLNAWVNYQPSTQE